MPLGEIPLHPLEAVEEEHAHSPGRKPRPPSREGPQRTPSTRSVYADARSTENLNTSALERQPSTASRTNMSIDSLDPEGMHAISERIHRRRSTRKAHRRNPSDHGSVTDTSGMMHSAQGMDAENDGEKEEILTHDPFDESARFDLGRLLQETFSESQARGNAHRSMGLAFRDLQVTGYGSGVKLGETCASVLTGPFRSIFQMRSMFRPPVKTILRDLEGCVKPGEMLLVLGRPGAGCTSFLKALASYRDGFRSIDGTILYEGLDHKAIDGPLRGDVVYSPEDDIHFPTLTVGETLAFATATRAPNAKYRITLGEKGDRKEYINLSREVLATVLGLRHTYNTKVGNDLIRGVSGGEKKRVSIAEALAARAKIALFDNSSRGLDASTALEFVTALRISTNIAQLTTVASIYQAGENLAQLFDKVIVLNQGRMVYFGPFEQATSYFKSIGYLPQDRQTTADFLVACTDANGRRLNPEFQGFIPLTADEQVEAFRNSPIGQANRVEVENYIAALLMEQTKDNAHRYVGLARDERAKHTAHQSKYLLSWPMQVRLAVKRRALVALGDFGSHLTVVLAALFQALIIGSVYYNMQDNTDGFFSRGGVLFFSLLYNSFTAMSEISMGYEQRPIIIRQKRFAMLRPSADALGNTILDFPIRMVSLLIFDIVVYFMTNLSRTADKFFTYFGVTCLITYTMVAFFRMLAAATRSEPIATLWAGVAVIDIALYTGYMIPRPSMRVWWHWLSYCQPVAFGFEILLSNEYRGKKFLCEDAMLVPNGPDYPNVNVQNQVCPVAGARPGERYVDGPTYLWQTYQFTWDNVRRNAGIVLAFWIVFVITYLVVSERQIDPAASGGVMLYRRNKHTHAMMQKLQARDEETPEEEEHAAEAFEANLEHANGTGGHIKVSDDVFTWDHINYDVLIKGNPRRLLDDVSGYVAPGKMTALMGESGAGKTTLLNVLAQRTNVGVVHGDFAVNGRPLPRSFQADTGYCQQQDVHLAQQTVREALQFSALLRQPRETPKQERLNYVETVIDVLGMHSFADAIVGEVGEGLNVEQRKRLTIGVELAAKPRLLLFLDEPTSGLDAQAAWSIVKFLKKLAAEGQAILCTIHQPSGELFNQFDRLLLLQKGGKMVYFGDLGPNSTTLISYFEQRSGVKCGENANPAEYILDVIGAGATATTDKNWSQLFRESPQAVQLRRDLDDIFRRNAKPIEQTPEAHASQTREYAQPFVPQLMQVTWRAFVAYWRNPLYVSTKMTLNLVSGLVVGSSFWAQGAAQSKIALQNRLFACFMALVSSTTLSQHLQPEFIRLRKLYEAREAPSKMYTWYVMVMSAMIVEVPWNLLGGTLYWLPWYWMIQFPSDSKRAAYSWGLYMLYQLYYSTFGQAMAAISPNAMIASILFSTFFSFVVLFCGVVQPPPQLPYFWSSWMFYLSPFTWIVEGILGNAIGGVDVQCLVEEMNQVNPPPGKDCHSWLDPFTTGPNARGYWKPNPKNDGSCLYCQYQKGDDYLSSVWLNANHRFADLGIILAYTAFNTALVFALFYLFRVHRWGQSKKKSQTLVQPPPPEPEGVPPAQPEAESSFAERTAGVHTPQTSNMGFTPTFGSSGKDDSSPQMDSSKAELIRRHPDEDQSLSMPFASPPNALVHDPSQAQRGDKWDASQWNTDGRAHPLAPAFDDEDDSPHLPAATNRWSQVLSTPPSSPPRHSGGAYAASRRGSRNISRRGSRRTLADNYDSDARRSQAQSGHTLSGLSYYYEDEPDEAYAF